MAFYGSLKRDYEMSIRIQLNLFPPHLPHAPPLFVSKVALSNLKLVAIIPMSLGTL